MVELAATSSVVYAFIASWFTPSYLFIFINLVIGTIAITTRFAKPKARVDPPQLVRSPSLLHRLMSFNLGCYKNQSPTTTLEETKTETENQNPVSHNHDPAQETQSPVQHKLTRAPSLLERVMSVKFNRSKSIEEEKNEPEPVPVPEYDIGGNESDHEEGVDEKADDFIKRFKEQLRLQRLESILRYRDMLKGK